MIHLIGRILANAVALLATQIVPGIRFTGSWLTLIVAGAVFGLFNMFVRPVVVFLSLPAIVLTLGLFYFVMNGILLWLAGRFFIPGYTVRDVWAGMLGSLVIALVNWALGTLFGGK